MYRQALLALYAKGVRAIQIDEPTIQAWSYGLGKDVAEQEKYFNLLLDNFVTLMKPALDGLPSDLNIDIHMFGTER